MIQQIYAEPEYQQRHEELTDELSKITGLSRKLGLKRDILKQDIQKLVHAYKCLEAVIESPSETVKSLAEMANNSQNLDVNIDFLKGRTAYSVLEDPETTEDQLLALRDFGKLIRDAHSKGLKIRKRYKSRYKKLDYLLVSADLNQYLAEAKLIIRYPNGFKKRYKHEDTRGRIIEGIYYLAKDRYVVPKVKKILKKAYSTIEPKKKKIIAGFILKLIKR